MEISKLVAELASLPESQRRTYLTTLKTLSPVLYARVIPMLDQLGESTVPRRRAAPTNMDRTIAAWPAGKKIRGWEIVQLLGKANGHVYWAKKKGHKDVALKRVFLEKDAGPAEKKALHILENLPEHPFLVGIREWFPVPKADELVIVMEKGEGSLADRPTLAPLLELEKAVHYINGLARALDYLHENGIAHLDVKPSNLIVFGGDTVKLGDYGAIRVITDGSDGQVSCLLGTPYYVAPEVEKGRFSEKSDQYSLGITYLKIRTGGRKLPAGLAPDEAAVVKKALSRNPAKRWESCLRFVKELERCLTKKIVKEPDPDGGKKPDDDPPLPPIDSPMELTVERETDLLIAIPQAIKEPGGKFASLAGTSLAALSPGETLNGDREFRIGADSSGSLRLYANPPMKAPSGKVKKSVDIPESGTTDVTKWGTYTYYFEWQQKFGGIRVEIEGSRPGVVRLRGVADRAELTLRINMPPANEWSARPMM